MIVVCMSKMYVSVSRKRKLSNLWPSDWQNSARAYKLVCDAIFKYQCKLSLSLSLGQHLFVFNPYTANSPFPSKNLLLIAVP